MKPVHRSSVLGLLGLMVALSTLALAADAPAAGKASLKGKVVYGRDGVAKIAVSLEGAVKKSATTDDKGEFAFNDLPAGDYKLEAKGIAKNTKRKGSAEVTVAEPPAKTEPVTIELK